MGLLLGLLVAAGGLGSWTARRSAQAVRQDDPAARSWLGAAAWLQPLDAEVQARRLGAGLETWPWAAWAGREQWAWHWAEAQREGQAGREARAVEGLRRCTQLRPTWAPGWLQLALAEERQGRLAEADAAVERALSLEPNFGRARAWLCVRLAAQGRLAEARRELKAIHAILALRVQREEPSEYTLYIQYVAPEWVARWDKKLSLSTGFDGNS